MNFLKSSLATKLWSALAVVVVLMVATLLMATGRSTALAAKQDAVALAEADKVFKVARWVGLIETNATRVTAAVLSSDPAVNELYKDQIPRTVAEISKIQKAIEEMDLGDEGRALFQQIGADRKEVLTSLSKATETKKAGDQAGAVKELNQNFLPAIDKYLKKLQQLSEVQARNVTAVHEGFAAQRRVNTQFAMGMVALLLVLLVIGTYFLIRIVREPLRHAIEVANAIAGGDLTVRVETDRKDEFGEMMTAVDHMKTQLVSVVSDVRDGTVNIATASDEIAMGNADLANRTEQTASALQSTASNMEHLMERVQHSSDSASQANQLAISAAKVAQRGGHVVGQVVSTMQEINQGSHRISDIISVIDGIAFQTNILALNAAVEAARAGEQGRGFAVVASEVRSLAGRSATAAKEIKALINTSLEKVDDGSRLVGEAGKTMDEIVSAVQRVSDIIGDISAGTSEQVQGISGVNSAVVQVDQMTQQNSALVEQSAAAASSMKDQAQRLAQIVAQFKLLGTGSPAWATASRAGMTTTLKPVAAPRRPLSAPASSAASNGPKPTATPKALPAKKVAPKPTAAGAAQPAPRLAAPAGTSAGKSSEADWESF